MGDQQLEMYQSVLKQKEFFHYYLKHTNGTLSLFISQFEKSIVTLLVLGTRVDQDYCIGSLMRERQ